MRPNYAIKPTPEQALGTNRTMLPARLIAALAFIWLLHRKEFCGGERGHSLHPDARLPRCARRLCGRSWTPPRGERAGSADALERRLGSKRFEARLPHCARRLQFRWGTPPRSWRAGLAGAPERSLGSKRLRARLPRCARRLSVGWCPPPRACGRSQLRRMLVAAGVSFWFKDE